IGSGRKTQGICVSRSLVNLLGILRDSPSSGAQEIFSRTGFQKVWILQHQRQNIFLSKIICLDLSELPTMKNIITTTAVIPHIFFASIAWSKTPDQDAFQACMSRAKQDSLTCTAGCGMILQQCYEEGISDINSKINNMLSQIKYKNGGSCGNLADSYLSEATHMDGDISQKANDIPGWIGSELALNFAKQRLDNLRLIQQSCKP
ncbi:hypothetical protein, partial [Paraburkholderia sp. J63]|uniref:hypothetical protein n=1 Tax=Paraburkholderia sp. J63 TaxID=2805434 RepID=UPI002ABD8F59